MLALVGLQEQGRVGRARLLTKVAWPGEAAHLVPQEGLLMGAKHGLGAAHLPSLAS